MSVREYKSRHDDVSELPLVTESATVVGVEAMDRDRQGELRRAVGRWLERAGVDGDYEVPTGADGWSDLVGALRRDGRASLARRVAAVGDRVGRPRPMLVRTRFRVDEPFDYLAGQYVGFRYGSTARAYSLASAPARAVNSRAASVASRTGGSRRASATRSRPARR